MAEPSRDTTSALRQTEEGRRLFGPDESPGGAGAPI